VRLFRLYNCFITSLKQTGFCPFFEHFKPSWKYFWFTPTALFPHECHYLNILYQQFQRIFSIFLCSSNFFSVREWPFNFGWGGVCYVFSLNFLSSNLIEKNFLFWIMPKIYNMTLRLPTSNFGRIWRKIIDFSCKKKNYLFLFRVKNIFWFWGNNNNPT
jgi:hypothetical protein